MKKFIISLGIALLVVAAFVSYRYKNFYGRNNDGFGKKTSSTNATAEEIRQKEEIERVKELVRSGKSRLRVKRSREGNVRILWTEVSGSEKYVIYRSQTRGGVYRKIDSAEKRFYRDTTAKARSIYYYKVVGITTASGASVETESQFSNIVRVFVHPKKPKAVIIGECFAEAMAAYAKGTVPSYFKFVPKVGANTYTLYHDNSESYNGKSISPIERVAYFDPDRVYFLVGVNEAAYGTPEGAIGNLKKMRKLLKKSNRSVITVLMSVSPCGRHSSLNIPSAGKVKAFNRAYRKFANSCKDVYYCDIYSILADRSGYLKSSWDAGDGCHWNSNAANAVGRYVRKYERVNF